MSVLMSLPTRNPASLDGSFGPGDGSHHPGNFGLENPSWSNTSVKFGSMRSQPPDGSYHAFDWNNVNHMDTTYMPPAINPPSKDRVSSYEFCNSAESFTPHSFMAFPETENVSEEAQYSPSRSTGSGTFSFTHGTPGAESFTQRPNLVRRISPGRMAPTSAPQQKLAVPKRPRPSRRHSDQSAVSSPNSAVHHDKGSGSGSGNGSVTASNEAHIIAERRYRNNLNAKIALIRSALENAQFRSQSKDSYRSRGGTYFVPEMAGQEADPTGPASPCGKDRRRKADILDEAAEYIRFADMELRHLSEEVQWLTQALAAAQSQPF